ncbi:MAG TPA: hypothetical protein DCP97_01040 [Ruminococcaceae bacterium]|nr:hypothetical protein [Oscillospiraceae bacterium]
MRKKTRDKLTQILCSVIEGAEYCKTASNQYTTTILGDCGAAVKAVSDAVKANLSENGFNCYNDIFLSLNHTLAAVTAAAANSNPVAELCEAFISKVNELIDKLNDEPEVKLEIVFMPYKASMWDSLESIWRAACADPRCEAYVVPIPYYDRNPDYSFAEINYEGGLFPPYVPITHYENYDLSLRKPDVIYIHNPFDGGNIVTSVDPKYYSSELKRHTDMLVYVPYYFTCDLFPESHISLPSYRYVNKIAVQSQRVKKQLAKFIPEHKLLAIGSPKADRMIYCEKNKVVPSDWAEQIKDKKVVMYNISLNGLLHYDVQCIKKMRYVFNCFKNNSGAVVLWRPHPLIKSTLKSMKPNLYSQYLQLEEDFVSQKMGILDTTPDINMSIAICDAYVGEESSSVVQLFGITGKPVFLTNMNISDAADDDDKCAVHFLDCDFNDGCAWFVSEPNAALCKINLSTRQTEVIAQLDIKSAYEYPFSDIKKIGDKIYLLPFNSDELYIFDLKTKASNKVSFKNTSRLQSFDRLIHYKNYLLLKPKTFEAIVKYDINTGECSYYYDCIKEFADCRIFDAEPLFSWAVITRGDLLLMASIITNKVLEFNMETGEYKIHTVGSSRLKYFGMAFDGNNYWLTAYGSSAIVKWNYETGSFTEYSTFPQGFAPSASLPANSPYINPFVGAVSAGGYTYLFSCHANMNLKINNQTDEISVFDLNTGHAPLERKNLLFACESNHYFAKKLDETHIAALSSYDDSLIIYDTKTEQASVYSCRIPVDSLQNLQKPFEAYMGRYNFNPNACKEDAVFKTLPHFLDFISSGACSGCAMQNSAMDDILLNADGTCGEKINQTINKLANEMK